MKMENGPHTVPASSQDSRMSFANMINFDMLRDCVDSEVPSPSNILPQFEQDHHYAEDVNLMDNYEEFYNNNIFGHGQFDIGLDLSEGLVELKTSPMKNHGSTSTDEYSVLPSNEMNFSEVKIKKELMEPSYEDFGTAYTTTPFVHIKHENVEEDVVEFKGNCDFVEEQVLNDNILTCLHLGISIDPKNWSKDDVHKWIGYTLAQFNLPMVQLEYFNITGAVLCCMTEDDFSQMMPQPCAGTLAAQLVVWKWTAENDRARQRLHQPPPTPSPHPVPTPSPQPAQVPVFKVDESMFDISMCQWSNTPVPSPVTNRDINTPSPGDNTLRVPSIIPNSSRSISDYSSDSGVLSDDDISEDGLELKSTRQSSHSHIHLWQFLKELLLNPQTYRNCIRWMDRSKGIFKIEDSVLVAKLWGRRKNRPAMNYDKLSRSIRQYYKKGIMRKTERSQRLVYQFCHPYSVQCQ